MCDCSVLELLQCHIESAKMKHCPLLMKKNEIYDKQETNEKGGF